MTWLARLMSLFPTIALVAMASALLAFVHHPSWLTAAAAVYFIYGFPLTIFRLHSRFFPAQEGISRLNGKDYSPWWGAHQIQLIYSALPVFEVILKLIPGAFSLWLRGWGSRVGKGVYWTPQVEIMDRDRMRIGDHVIFGHRVLCSAHIIKKKSDRIVLYVRKVEMGENSFIGAGSHLGPGIKVASGVFVPIQTDLYPNESFDPEGAHEAQTIS